MFRVAWLWFAFAGAACAANLVPVSPLGLRVASGFRVSLFADSDLANDIFSMTLDSRGDVVVTGPGYIRTLRDVDNDGVADSATLFAPTQTGGMGMCFDGPNFYFVGDGGLFRFTDNDLDGAADGPGQRLLSLNFLEHGGHAVRKGPDGWLYVMAGNETTFTAEHYGLPGSPILRPEAGALLRLPPDASACEVIAEGFRNPYDFDFNVMGDLFTYDSDVESDFLLPWYMPTRIYHIAYGGHHGWRLPGWRRSWNRPDYYSDAVEMLAPLGRGSPTGVVCYRHYQFPIRYRNGLFALDWTFGRVFFVAPTPAGSTYGARPEVFLEATGTQGFAPNDAVVARDGSLLVSIGGRKTRGAIYRIEYVAERGAAFNASNWFASTLSEVEAVLTAPQPLEAWSRALWTPLASQLGADPFIAAAVDNSVAPGLRIRAIEILTEMFGGLAPGTATTLSRANSPQVRARTAWSVSRVPPANAAALLSGLSRDADAAVRRTALEAMFGQTPDSEAVRLNLGHADKRVRQAATRLAARLPGDAWNTLWKPPPENVQARMSLNLARLRRSPPAEIYAPAIDDALAALKLPQNSDVRLDALRLIMLALGDWNLNAPSVEAYTGYETTLPLKGQEGVVRRIANALRPLVTSGDAEVEFEAARLLAMIRDNAPETIILPKIASHTTATSDFHHLTVLSRLNTTLSSNGWKRVANAVLALDRKLDGQQLRPKQNWSARLAEVVGQIVQRNPPVADAILRDPSFGLPGHVALAPSFGPDRRMQAARAFFGAVTKRTNFVWTAQLIDLLSTLPAAEVFPVFRKQWNNVALRDELLLRFAAKPQPADRDKFLMGLASVRSDVVIASAGALMELPPDSSARGVLPVARALRRYTMDAKEQPLRSLLLALMRHQTGEAFSVQETSDLARSYQPVFDWFRRKFPALARNLESSDNVDISYWLSLLPAVQWQKGDAVRGESIFQTRGCLTCHSGNSPVGPDLGGVTRRLSARDVIISIADPNRDIAPAYRSTTFRMRSGETYTGVVVFESGDGVIVQTSANTTIRLAEMDIASREPSNVSLMPTGLLNGIGRPELADLYAYLARLPSSR